MVQSSEREAGLANSEIASPVDALLGVSNIEVRYQGSILVLKSVSLTVARGEIVTLLGSNGAGKTTTLKAISSLLQAEEGAVTEGTITFDGHLIQNADPVSVVRRGLVQVLEGRRVLEHMSVWQNLLVASAAARDGGHTEERLARVYELFPILREFRERQAGYLSGGQQQMLVIGRALMCQPRLLLLDEPSLGLAPRVYQEIFACIERINREDGTAVLLVEQNARQALTIAHRGYVLENGRVVLGGPSAELRENQDLREFYLGMGQAGVRKSFREIKHYRRRRRWLG